MTTGAKYWNAAWRRAVGCTPCSPGCSGPCWAAAMAHRHAGHPNPEISRPAQGTTEMVNGRPRWTGKVNLVPAPPPRSGSVVAVCWMSDLWHPSIPEAHRVETLQLAWEANLRRVGKPHARFQRWLFLTKRPGAMAVTVKTWMRSLPVTAIVRPAGVRTVTYDLLNFFWFGASVCTQTDVDAMLPGLAKIPANRWLSVEPLLEPLSIVPGFPIRWMVVGAQTGRDARPCDPNWVRSLELWCQDYGVCFFLKQLDAKRTRALDGRTFDAVPWA